MKKKILAMLLACTMLVPTGMTAMAEETEAVETEAAAAEETAAAETTMLTMQGMDEKNIIWTLVIDVPNANACVSLTPEDADTTYIAGPVVFDTEAGNFTITDTEDGNDYVFGFQDVSATETILTYEPTGSEVQLVTVEQNTMEAGENMEIFAGIDSTGTQITIGFDYDAMEMALDMRDTEGSVTQMAGTFEADAEAGTLTFHAESGDIVFGVTTIEGEDNLIDITLNDETIRFSKIDMAAVNAVSGE